MATKALGDYFQPVAQRQALEAYATRWHRTAWCVPMKMDLYAGSRVAFDPATSDTEAFKEFEVLYDNLNLYWTVFRPHGAKRSWKPRQIFDTIRREFSNFACGGDIALPNLLNSGQLGVLDDSLMKIKEIKPNQNYPAMTASKFLHFYNPALFPIYDTAVIQNKVLKEFNADFKQHCVSHNLAANGVDDKFLGYYMSWASSLLSTANPQFMEVFVEWLEKELPKRKFDEMGRTALGSLYATAFEFTAIGAAVFEE